MKTTLILMAILIAVGFIFLLMWRRYDHARDHAEMARLLALQPVAPRNFDPAMVRNLPGPARRYFEYMIAPGTPLYRVAAIEMTGLFSLGTKESPAYMQMKARQILAAPHGFVWKMSGRSGIMQVSGSDSARWTRFWVAGLMPVAHLGGTPDHARAAFGRYIAEAAFWTPAALLPGENVTWHPVTDDTAKATVRHNGLAQDVYLTVAADGQPTQISFPRWTNANSDKTYRLQPFGGYLSNFVAFSGFRLPTHIEAGNFFETDAYFPFFIADVSSVNFPEPD